MRVENKTALITGAAHRIGGGIAESLAQSGCNILLHYHSSIEAAEETAERVRSIGVKVELLQEDLSLPESSKRLFTRIPADMAPDILINSAAPYPRANWKNLEWEELEQAYALISYAPFALSREFARLPSAVAVINILDARMIDYDSQHLAYHLSKRSLFDFTRILSWELAPQIRVNAVAPGIILPDRSDDPELLEKYRKGNPLKMIGSLGQITQTVHFLLGNDFVTGQVIFVDGGRHLRGRFYGT